MLRSIIAARDDERARIARELHDEVGQQLTALRLILEHHQTDCRVSSRTEVDHALSVVRSIDEEIDSLAWRIRPRAVEELGLEASLSHLVHRWAHGAPVDAECRCVLGSVRLRPAAEHAVFRVAQEALHNVLKHAHATHVDVICRVRGTSVALIVQDDGVGFDRVNDRAAGLGMGLRGMRERAGLVGGTLRVESATGRGTTVSLRIPRAVVAGYRAPVDGRKTPALRAVTGPAAVGSPPTGSFREA